MRQSRRIREAAILTAQLCTGNVSPLFLGTDGDIMAALLVIIAAHTFESSPYTSRTLDEEITRSPACRPFGSASLCRETRFCRVNASLSGIPQLEHSFPVRQRVALRLLTKDDTGKLCETGGAGFRAGLVGRALLPASVADNGDGSYAVTFWTGVEPGHYKLLIVLDFDQCEGSVRCDASRVLRMARGSIGPYNLFVGEAKAGHHKTVANAHALPPRGTKWWWVHDARGQRARVLPEPPACSRAPRSPLAAFGDAARAIPRREYAWLPTIGRPLNITGLIETMRGRWLHFVGKSMMRTTVHTLVQVLHLALYRRNRNKTVLFERLMPPVLHSNSTASGYDALFQNLQETSAFYIPSIRALITFGSHDNSLAMTSTDPAAMRAYVDAHFAYVRAGLSLEVAPLFSFGPSALVFNRGLHYAAGFRDGGLAAVFARSERAVLCAFAAQFASGGTVLVRTTTAPTHFWADRLPAGVAWLCRTPQRLECIAQLSAAAAPAPWLVADMAALGHMRADCVYDNRHYYCGPCRGAFVTMLTTILASAPMREESAGFERALDGVATEGRARRIKAWNHCPPDMFSTSMLQGARAHGERACK